MAEEHHLQEVPFEDGAGGEPLREGATEIAALVSAGTGVAALGVGGIQAYYARASYELQREEIEREAVERAHRAELRRQLQEMRRMQAFEDGGIDGLDEFDDWHTLTDFEDY